MYSRPTGPPPGNFQQGQYTRPSAPPPNRDAYPLPQQQQQGQGQYSMQTVQIQGTNRTQQFALSNCSGRKKALLIGINYIGTSNQLRGCINDVNAMFNFLTSVGGYLANDIVLLTDNNNQPSHLPTRDNILRAMSWLVNGAQPGDSLFFHYSGHGGQEKDLNGDEISGYDECIYPVDFKSAGSIIDDIMHDIMVKPLPAGCRLTGIFDSCHSGTALDLPFTYRAQDGGLKEYNILKDSAGDGLNILMGYMNGNSRMMLSGAKSIFGKITNYKSDSKIQQIQQSKMSPADVITFSGCRDDQTSADANEAGTFTGALSWAFLTVMSQTRGQGLSYLTLLQSIRSVMAQKYTQKPQLSSSHQINPNTAFFF